MVVNHSGKEVIRRAYRVKVARKVKVYILHRHDLCVTSAGGAAFYAEDRSERRLAKCRDRFFTYAAQTVGKTDRCRGFTLACGSRGHCGNKDELSLFAFINMLFKTGKVYLSLIFSVMLKTFFGNMSLFCDLVYRAHDATLRYFYVCKMCH